MPKTDFKTGHVGLNVTDLERSVAFYTEVFQLEVVGQSRVEGRRYAFLGSGGEVKVTLWQQGARGFNRSAAGLHHLSFRADSLEDVLNTEKKLRELGVRFHYEGVVAHREGTTSGGIFFEDPDGIRLEIFTASVDGGAVAPHGTAPSCGFF